MAKIPTELPDTPEINRKLAETQSSEKRYIYDYELKMYAYVDDCTGGSIRHGRVYYYLFWRYDDDGIGHAEEFKLDPSYPPVDLSDAETQLFAGCVQEFVSSHNIYQIGPSTWANTTDFPVTEDPIVRFARGEPLR